MTDIPEEFARAQEVEKISIALFDAIAGLHATRRDLDLLLNGIGRFASLVLVAAAVKDGHNPEEVVESWCSAMKESSAANYKDMVGLGLKRPLGTPDWL
jgi:hypothetical protein